MVVHVQGSLSPSHACSVDLPVVLVSSWSRRISHDGFLGLMASWLIDLLDPK
jgi:hypothetical protein